MSLPDRLRDLADLAEADQLPETALRGLERAVGRAERDRWLTVAADHAGGCAALLRVLAQQLWRIDIWLKRGGPPAHAGPLLTAVYNAAEACELPTERQVQRILRHAMSADLADAVLSQPEHRHR